VRLGHRGHTRGDILGHGHDARAVEIHMQGQPFARGGNPAIAVIEFLKEVKALAIVVEKIKAAAKLIAQFHLAQIADVELGAEGGEVAGGAILGTKAHFLECLIGAAVEKHGVVAHVHVTVVVDPALFDRVESGEEGLGVGHRASGRWGLRIF